MLTLRTESGVCRDGDVSSAVSDQPPHHGYHSKSDRDHSEGCARQPIELSPDTKVLIKLKHRRCAWWRSLG